MAAPSIELPALPLQTRSSAPFAGPSFSDTLEHAFDEPLDSAEPIATKPPNPAMANTISPAGKVGIPLEQILPLAPEPTTAQAPAPVPDLRDRLSTLLPDGRGSVAYMTGEHGNLTDSAVPLPKPKSVEAKHEGKQSAPHAGAPESVQDSAELSLAVQQAAATPDLAQPVAKASPNAETRTPVDEPAQVANATGLASASPPASGDLALAMRITAGGDRQNSNPGLTLSSDAVKATNEVTSSTGHPVIPIAAVSAEPQQKHDADQHSSGGEAEAGGTQLASAGSTPTASKETAPTANTDFETEFNKFHSEPVKSAHVQISGENSASVDIRLVERGGSLSVSVRSSDTALAKTLSDHSAELTAHLSADHYKTETGAPNSSKNSSNERQSSPFSGGQGGSGSNQGKRQNSQQNQDPEWVQEFENLPGTFQKRINYTWPQ